MKRTRSASKKPISSAGADAPSVHSDVAAQDLSARRESSVRLALLTVAILCAALGFALSFFWIAALVLMGVLWGAMIAERPQRRETVKGLVTEMVTAVVDEAKDVRDATAAADPADPPPGDEARHTGT